MLYEVTGGSSACGLRGLGGQGVTSEGRYVDEGRCNIENIFVVFGVLDGYPGSIAGELGRVK